MARTALSALGDLGRLEADSFLFISDEADPHAEKGGANAGDMVTAHAAVEATFGLGEASLGIGNAGAPSGFGFGVPDGLTTGAGITLIEPQFYAAKGGIKGPPDTNNDPETPSGAVLDQYFSGSSLGTDTNPEGEDDGYDIWIDFKGSWTADLQQAVLDVADYFTTIITADIGGGFYRGKTVDDLYVTAEMKTIDGDLGVLAQAGPSAVWTANDLTAAGSMQFDVADAGTLLDWGNWYDVVMHEFMHVLGFGTLWNYGKHKGLVEGTQYVGEEALDAYRISMGDNNLQFIPVEGGGGSGTAGGHWDEDELGNELMTGYINTDKNGSTPGDNVLEEFSVQVLADLGYVVEYQDYPYDNPAVG